MINKSRVAFIKELETFINNKQNELNSVFEALEWTEESLKEDVKVCCPVNPGHWISESVLPHHKEICEMIKDGYQKEELEKQPPDSTFFYEKASNVIPVVLDQSTVNNVLSGNNLSYGNATKHLPKTVDRWSAQFTPEQRLAIYDFIVSAAKTVEKPSNVTLEDLMVDFEKKEEQGEKPKSELEILAEMRDYKRRRQSYRAKNVHITKKSYTEIMREVIENQTNYLMETRKFEDSRKRREDSVESKRKYNYDSDNYDSSESVSSKYKDHHSRHKRDDYDSKSHHSRHKFSKHHSPKRKKHKRERTRSRSPSHHKHKKSHKKKSHHD